MVKVEDQLEILDSDDEPLKDNHDNDNIYVDSEDEALAEALTASRVEAAAIEIADEDDEEEEDDAGTRTGWGECPMCTEVSFQKLGKLMKQISAAPTARAAAARNGLPGCWTQWGGGGQHG